MSGSVMREAKRCPEVTRVSGCSVTASARGSPGGETDAPSVGKNQRQSPVHTGFRASQQGSASKKCRFLAVSVPKPRNSSKPLS
ncbi:hypothetical protein EN871_10425 [bacterium M00.F.Ca.ET.228.01.1.1]|nr:hypothetical protein EN871_10425 [bacterium M00.F.Ca.ET.228.01.1.1]TGS02860.1 hypothetical protein EN834_10420 [bacterium M00.F.Ca.ET.191.01.1.1]TGU06242.1 hypothetical protein EN798_14500 [bacterium M00.F.Ca.ET.155.01.1.1]